MTKQGKFPSMSAKRSFRFDKQRKSSICLEDPFWFYLKHCAEENGMGVEEYLLSIIELQNQKNRSQFVRCHLFLHLLKRVDPKELGLLEGTYDFPAASADH